MDSDLEIVCDLDHVSPYEEYADDQEELIKNLEDTMAKTNKTENTTDLKQENQNEVAVDTVSPALEAALKQNKSLADQLAKVEEERDQLKAQLKKLEETNKLLHETNENMQKTNTKQAESLKDLAFNHEVLERRLEKAEKSGNVKEGEVLVDGKVQKVVGKYTVTSLLDAARKRFVGELVTVLVLDREGD